MTPNMNQDIETELGLAVKKHFPHHNCSFPSFKQTKTPKIERRTFYYLSLWHLLLGSSPQLLCPLLSHFQLDGDQSGWHKVPWYLWHWLIKTDYYIRYIYSCPYVLCILENDTLLLFKYKNVRFSLIFITKYKRWQYVFCIVVVTLYYKCIIWNILRKFGELIRLRN